MRILPILFNTDMVRAILDGRKTATRRVVKPQPEHVGCLWKIGGARWTDNISSFNPMPVHSLWNRMPYQPGDILYVRETWKCWRAHRFEATADIMFRAGGDGVQLKFANGNTDSIDRFDFDEFVKKWFSHNEEWKPSLFMPKEAARIWLKVKDVRMERLCDITEDQAKAEGALKCYEVIRPDEEKPVIYKSEDEGGYYVVGFKSVWNSTVKNSDLALYGWDANPWVWVIEFERCDKPGKEVHSGNS